MNMNSSISEPDFVLYISQLPNILQNGSVFRIYIWISVFRRKNGLEIRSLVPQILCKYKRSFFLGRPVSAQLSASQNFSVLELINTTNKHFLEQQKNYVLTILNLQHLILRKNAQQSLKYFQCENLIVSFNISSFYSKSCLHFQQTLAILTNTSLAAITPH